MCYPRSNLGDGTSFLLVPLAADAGYFAFCLSGCSSLSTNVTCFQSFLQSSTLRVTCCCCCCQIVLLRSRLLSHNSSLSRSGRFFARLRQTQPTCTHNILGVYTPAVHVLLQFVYSNTLKRRQNSTMERKVTWPGPRSL